MNNIDVYPLEEDEETGRLKFFFESAGQTKIVKSVEYTYLQDYGLGGLYNLGFGDYDKDTKGIIDDANSNNGDMRLVLNTVLTTIPLFFEDYPLATIAVQGSDSSAGFEEHCRLTCTNEKCGEGCRKLNRRITTYRYFLDKSSEELSKDYSFQGYIAALRNLVPYQASVKYDAVFISRKLTPNFVP